MATHECLLLSLSQSTRHVLPLYREKPYGKEIPHSIGIHVFLQTAFAVATAYCSHLGLVQINVLPHILD